MWKWVGVQMGRLEFENLKMWRFENVYLGMKKNIWWLIGLLILFIGIICLFLIKTDFSFHGIIKTEKFAHLGAFVSGMIGVSISGITLIIVLQNKRQTEETNEQNLLNNIYDNLNKDINDATLGEFKGSEAYRNYSVLNTENNPLNNLLDNINLVLNSFEMYFEYLSQKNFSNQHFKELSENRLYLLFYSKLLWPLLSSHGLQGSKLAEIHDDSINTVLKYCILTKKCISYLKTKSLIVDSEYKKINLDEIDNTIKILELKKNKGSNI